jgi:hypothetical protein
MIDIFEFWRTVQPADRMHPVDRKVLDRVEHGFDLECLPACFGGPLRTAKVVLLYLSPGWSQQDHDEAETTEAQAYYMRRRAGCELFRGPEASGFKWLISRTKCFLERERQDDWKRLWPHLAVLNICAYHSKAFDDAPLLAALPSSRASIGWAQDVLFSQAEAGERVVICLRSARFWGLKEGEQYGRSLFAPPVTRGGHMIRGTMRKRIIKAVESVTGGPPPGMLPDATLAKVDEEISLLDEEDHDDADGESKDD